MRYGLALVAALSALVLAAGSAAEPAPIRERQAEAQRVLAEMEAIDLELGSVVEAYNGATLELGRIERELEESRTKLRAARANYREADARLQARLVAIYTSDQASALDVLLGAQSVADLIDRLDSVERISALDARVAAEVRRYRDEVRERQQRLVQAQAQQERLVAERAAQRERIEARLAERERLYASIEAEIADLEAAERERQRRLAAEARAELAAQENAAQPAPAPVPAAPAQPPAPPSAPSPPPATPPPAAPPPAAPPASSRGARAARIALRYLGIPYRWGGSSPSTGFDCSGFVMFVYRQVGVSLPHHAASQYRYGRPVSRSQLQPGDVVFFHGLGHNGIYIGGGRFVHSPHTGDVVKISPLAGWYSSRWVGARRL